MPISPVRPHSQRGLTWLTMFAIGLCLLRSRPAQAYDATTVAILKRVEAKSRAVAAKVIGATVGIINPSLAGRAGLGEGSGVVVSEDGLILTAGHVLGQVGCDLTIVFPDGRRAGAKALGVNFSRDSGLAKLTGTAKWPHVEMGRSGDIKPGTWCMALGHSGGIQQGRTPPIRLGRILYSGKDARFLVTDATVISGDSGGPLFDLDGRVIGIHSNIGMSVDQNQHVPIDVFRDGWNDLLAGKAIGSAADLMASAKPSPEKLKRFRELMMRRLMSGDPEVRDLLKGGRLNLLPGDIDRLIEKWEKSPVSSAPATPADTAASKPLDFLKFDRLFHERMAAGDPDVKGLIKDGTMMVTPEQMHQLMDQWEKRGLAANAAKAKPAGQAAAPATGSKKPETTPPADRTAAKEEKLLADQLAKFREMMKNAVPLGDGRFELQMTPGTTKDLHGLLGFLQAGALESTPVDYGKSSPTMQHDVAPIAAKASHSTVVVLCDGKPAVWGTVVRKDGYVVTKASEIHGKLTCKVGPREYPATLVKSQNEHDLALLKVETNELEPVTWADGNPPVAGSWLISAAPEEDSLELGIVSVPARAIPDAPKILLRNRAIVGVMLDPAAKEARIQAVTPNLPAAKSGLKPGDVILNIEGQATPNLKDVTEIIGKYNPGDKVTVEIRRDGKPMKLKMDLVSSDQMAPKLSSDQLTHLSEAGGTVSKRHSGFPNALTHDTVLQASQCGGPIVDLDGRTVGLNIARADRTASYAIPAGTARVVVDGLLAGIK